MNPRDIPTNLEGRYHRQVLRSLRISQAACERVLEAAAEDCRVPESDAITISPTQELYADVVDAVGGWLLACELIGDRDYSSDQARRSHLVLLCNLLNSVRGLLKTEALKLPE